MGLPYILLEKVLSRLGYGLHRTRIAPEYAHIPDAEYYEAFWAPWKGYGAFRERHARVSRHTIVPADRCYLLESLARQAAHLDGEFWECGVYRGGTALLLREVLDEVRPGAVLRLFDTFEGMPETRPDQDLHQAGDFHDTSREAVQALVGPGARIHPGFIPDTFRGLEGSSIAFAHVDVDIHDSVRDCCAFIHPRLVPGGILLFDDYGYVSCPGARRAVDDFFRDLPEEPLVLPNGQALVVKLPA